MQTFMKHYEEFEEQLKDMDRRMATIICNGFDDCNSLESQFKVYLSPCWAVWIP